MVKTKINSDQFAKRLGAYSHGYTVVIGDTKLIFTTGQIALDKDGCRVEIEAIAVKQK